MKKSKLKVKPPSRPSNFMRGGLYNSKYISDSNYQTGGPVSKAQEGSYTPEYSDVYLSPISGEKLENTPTTYWTPEIMSNIYNYLENLKKDSPQLDPYYYLDYSFPEGIDKESDIFSKYNIDPHSYYRTGDVYGRFYDYVKSPKYLERLKNFRSDDKANIVQQNRLNNLLKTKVILSQAREKNRKGFFMPSEGTDYPLNVVSLIGTGPEGSNLQHEIAHASQYLPGNLSFLTENEKNLIKNSVISESEFNKNPWFKNYPEEYKYEYFTKPKEYHARLNSLRRLAYDSGIHKEFGQDFSKEDIEKIKEKFQDKGDSIWYEKKYNDVKALLELSKDDESLIRNLNTIAYEDTNYPTEMGDTSSTMLVQNGGKLNRRGSDRAMVYGIADILKMIKNKDNRQQIAAKMIKDFNRDKIKYNKQNFLKASNLSQQGGVPNPLPQYGNAGDYYKQLMDTIQGANLFNNPAENLPDFDKYYNNKVKEYLDQGKYRPQTDGGTNYLVDTTTGERFTTKEMRKKIGIEYDSLKAGGKSFAEQAPIGGALAGLLDLQTAEADEIMNRKKGYFDNSLSQTSWSPMGFSQEGGDQEMDDDDDEDENDDNENSDTNINEFINVIKAYAEDLGFTNEDGSITKDQMIELLRLLESDMNADLEREAFAQLLSFFEDDDDEPLHEQIRKYWNRGVIPMNRREDVLKYSSDPVPHLEQGENFPRPETFKCGGLVMKKKDGGLSRWFKEKWVDIKTGEECGRQSGEKRGYPACRPSVKVSSDTPKTVGEMSASEKEKFKRTKTSSKRIPYSHRNGGTPTNPELYSKVKSEAKKKFSSWPSAYGSSYLVREYKKRGGTYSQNGGIQGGDNLSNQEIEEMYAAYGPQATISANRLPKPTTFRDINDNPITQFAKIFDPTGVTSWPDAYYAYEEFSDNPSLGNFGNLALNAIGAVPIIGKVTVPLKLAKGASKLIKYGDKVSDGLSKIESYPVNWIIENFEGMNSIIPSAVRKGAIKLNDLKSYLGNATTEQLNKILKDAPGTPGKGFSSKLVTKEDKINFIIDQINSANITSDMYNFIQSVPTVNNNKPKAQQGGYMNTMQQMMGYKDNSPFRNMPYQTFNTNRLTMRGVSRPLLAITDTGASTIMRPGYDYTFPGASSVMEIPMAKNGNFFKRAGNVLGDFGRSVADSIGNRYGLWDIDNSKYKTKFGQKYSGAWDKFNRNLGKAGAAAVSTFAPGVGSFLGERASAGINRLEGNMPQNQMMDEFMPQGAPQQSGQPQGLDMLNQFSFLLPMFQNALLGPSSPYNTNTNMNNPYDMSFLNMREGGIPDRYKNMGYTKVGQKRQSDRPGKKWSVLAKKGDQYKVVHGGAEGMSDFTKHKNEKRRDRFWDRMGGKNSAKAKDPFSPLYWHKRFGTWQNGGSIPAPPSRPF